MNYKTFLVDVTDNVAHVRFNRPDKANAMNQIAWQELKAIFESLDEQEDVRVIILSGEGKHFCAGIDLTVLMSIHQMVDHSCEGRKREKLRKIILDLQSTINAIEKCSKPVLAAIHNGCIGGAVDIIAACDMRYATKTAYFCVKEIEMGMVADLGTLQRLPKIIPYGIACEMAYTGRKVSAVEAQQFYLVNQVFDDQKVLLEEVTKIAQNIAKHSPLSIRGTKHILQHARDNKLHDSLEYMATWNAGMLLSKDLMEAFESKMSQRPPKYMD